MDIRNNQTQELFEKLYVKNAPSWALERDSDGSYKYHATQSAFSLFEQQQAEIELLKSDLAKAQAVPEGFVLMPRICTNKMAHAAKAIDGRLSAFKYADVYKAMIEAQEPAK